MRANRTLSVAIASGLSVRLIMHAASRRSRVCTSGPENLFHPLEVAQNAMRSPVKSGRYAILDNHITGARGAIPIANHLTPGHRRNAGRKWQRDSMSWRLPLGCCLRFRDRALPPSGCPTRGVPSDTGSPIKVIDMATSCRKRRHSLSSKSMGCRSM